MAIFLLDTDMLSLYQRNHPQVLAAITSHATDPLCVGTVTLEEQIGGWSALARSAKTPQAGEHAAMLLASLVVSWNRFAIAPHDRVSLDAVPVAGGPGPGAVARSDWQRISRPSPAMQTASRCPGSDRARV